MIKYVKASPDALGFMTDEEIEQYKKDRDAANASVRNLRKVPKEIQRAVEDYQDEYCVVKADAVEWAFKDYIQLHHLDKEHPIYKAWYYNDFREFYPDIYRGIYLDFNKYPLYEGF